MSIGFIKLVDFYSALSIYKNINEEVYDNF